MSPTANNQLERQDPWTLYIYIYIILDVQLELISALFPFLLCSYGHTLTMQTKIVS